jgi:hypothetical protein
MLSVIILMYSFASIYLLKPFEIIKAKIQAINLKFSFYPL